MFRILAYWPLLLVSMLGASPLLLPSEQANSKPQTHVVKLLRPECVKKIEPGPHFHCELLTEHTPPGIECADNSLLFTLRPDATADTCTELHIESDRN